MQVITAKRIYWLLIALFIYAVIHYTIKEIYWIYLLPVGLFILMGLLLRMDAIFFLTVLIVPLSINYDETPLGFGINVPTEPITFCLMLLMLFKLMTEGGIDLKVLKHPVTIFILLHLLWMIVTSITSDIPLVSFKYTLARFCFVMVFYFYGIQVFSRAKNISKFIWFYAGTFFLVIIYTTINHGLKNFTEVAAHSAMTPFYYDHTQYAAMISMFLPIMATTLLGKFSVQIKALALTGLLLLLTGLVLSYTRASWVSVGFMLVCSLVFIFRIPTLLVWTIVTGLTIFIAENHTAIMLRFENNRKLSSTDFASHLQSISNVRTDASNTERLNRWSCALRMFYLRPVVGWGPGTYQFVYGAFQLESEKTYISTMSGNRGNAHSEYLGPLSEQGLLGPVFFIGIAIATLISASRFIINSKSRKLRFIAIGLILGLITYWVHGFLNNFLYTEKASIPFWGFIGAIVAMRVYHQNETLDEVN